jgi:hypothetical protein
VAGPSLIKPQFPDDDGSADPALVAALTAYAAGQGGEHAVLDALSRSRVLVPIVAVLTSDETVDGIRREKESEMALPTLRGADGRRGVLAFTSLKTLQLWRPDARPVPVWAVDACRTAVEEKAEALVLDVAGPVPFAVDGVRLHLMAEGRPVPPPYQDPEVLAAIKTAFDFEEGVTDVRVGPGQGAELSVRFAVVPGTDEQAAVRRVGDRLADVLRGRIVGGVELAVARR